MVLLALVIMRSGFYAGLWTQDHMPIAMAIPTQAGRKPPASTAPVAFLIAKRPEMWYSMLSRKHEEITD